MGNKLYCIFFFVWRDRDELSPSSESRLAITRTNHHRISQATVLGDSQQIRRQSGNAGERAYERTNFVAARVNQERGAEMLRLLLFKKAKLAVGLRSIADSIATTTQDSHRVRGLWRQSL